MYKILSISILSLVFLMACEPQRDDDFMLGTAPPAPDFSLVMVEGDTNRFVYTDLSSGNFQRLWSFEGGTPKTSSAVSDTVLFSKKGIYNVSLAVSKEDGSGSAVTTKRVTVIQDAPLSCSGKMALLTGGCLADGKCWVFTKVAGAVKVGPAYGDWSWFASVANGLVDEQYDDKYCFTFDNLVYENRNNGQSIDPWQGYIPVNVTYPPGEFELIEGAGTGGRDLLVIPDDQFVGIMDSDNEYDVVKLTETELIISSRIRMPDGQPAAEGVFELSFKAE